MERSSGDPNRTGPLRGVRVVELAGLGPGPFAAMLLGDLGAEVVRIDRPGTPAAQPADIVQRSRSAVVQIDLKSQEGRDQVLRLCARADALIEGYRPGVMERLGIGPDVVLAVNPKLVYGRMTGWGQYGPLAQTAGHDINYIALPGALAAIGPPGQPPLPPLNLVGDYGGGALYLVVGLLAALLEARQSGEGQVVDAAMVDGASSLMSLFFSQMARGSWTTQRGDNLLDGGAPFYATYACSDGKHVAVGALEGQFYALLREKLALTDPVFDRQNDRAAWPAMRDKLAQVFATRPRDAWAELFEGSNACVSPVLTIIESAGHPHLAARSTVVRREGVLQPGVAPRFSRTQSGIQSSPVMPAMNVDALIEQWNAFPAHS